MRITIEKAALAAKLATASRICGRGLSALNKLLILRATDAQVQVLATDGNVEYCGAVVSAQMQELGEIAVNGKFLADLVKRLPDWGLSLETDGSGNLVLKSEQLRYTIAAEAAWDPASLSLDPPAGGLAVDGEQLAQAFQRVLFCVSRDVGMEGTSCLKIDPDPASDGVALVGLDGYGLARTILHDQSLRNVLQDRGPLLHRPYVEDLLRWLPHTGVQVALGEKRLHLRTSEESFSLPVSDWTYPLYSNILVKAAKAPTILEAGREALLAALERLSLFTTDILPSVVFDATTGPLTLSAQGDHGKAEEPLVAEVRGDALRVAFRAKQLMDVLRALSSERVRINISGVESPCLVSGLDEADADYDMIVMPMRTNETKEE
jgi:DNA polymerase-3 subunit beta